MLHVSYPSMYHFQNSRFCTSFFFALNSAFIIEGSLKVKLPTMWTDEKAEMGRVREEKRRRKKIQVPKKVQHLHQITLHYTNYGTLHFTTLDNTTVHYTRLITPPQT